MINLDLTGYAALNYSGTLTAYTTAPIPASHVGDVQLRVNLGWGFDPNDPCTPNWSWGDVKDYPVSICNSKSQEESDACSPYSVQSIRVAGELNKFKNADGSPNSNTLLTNNACKITDSPDPQAFSAPLAVSLQLESTLFNCTGNAADESPELDFSLSIPQANISKSDKFTGKVHKVSFVTPGKVGIYDVILTYRLKGKNKPAQEPITVKRKLYVTYDVSKIAHKISTLEKGCTWAAGLNQEGLIVDKLLTQVYAYGRANWRYGYDFGSKTKCTWEDLIDNAGCNYSDCHIFSQVLVNVGLAVSELVLLNADTDQDIRTIRPGDVIDLATLPAGHLNVRAVTNPDTVGSVTFKLNDQPVVRENHFPYAIGGDLNGDFRSWGLPTGMHTLTITPYTGKDGAGNQGVAYTATFSVVHPDASARAGSGYGKEGIRGLQAAPNPFTGRTTLLFSTLQPGFTTLDVLNARGETVARLFGGHTEPDKAYSVTFAAGQLPSGLYLARLVTHQQVTYYKLIHLK